MKGGLIEGLKMCFKGRHILSSHLGLLILITGAIIPILATDQGLNNSDISITNIFQHNFFYGILFLICIAAITLYFFRFAHNTIQLNIYQDFQNDPEKVKFWTVMPKFDKTFLSNWNEVLKFCFVWMIYYVILLIPVIILSFIPFIDFIVCLAFIILLAYSSEYLTMGFVTKFKASGNLDISLVFKYFPKIFIAHTILIIKFVIMNMLTGVLLFLGALIVSPLLNSFLGEDFSTFIIMLCYSYICVLIYLAYNYATAFIYYEKIFLTKDE